MSRARLLLALLTGCSAGPAAVQGLTTGPADASVAMTVPEAGAEDVHSDVVVDAGVPDVADVVADASADSPADATGVDDATDAGSDADSVKRVYCAMGPARFPVFSTACGPDGGTPDQPLVAEIEGPENDICSGDAGVGSFCMIAYKDGDLAAGSVVSESYQPDASGCTLYAECTRIPASDTICGTSYLGLWQCGPGCLPPISTNNICDPYSNAPGTAEWCCK